MTSNAASFRASSFSSRSTWRRSFSFSASAAAFFGLAGLVRLSTSFSSAPASRAVCQSASRMRADGYGRRGPRLRDRRHLDDACTRTPAWSACPERCGGRGPLKGRHRSLSAPAERRRAAHPGQTVRSPRPRATTSPILWLRPVGVQRGTRPPRRRGRQRGALVFRGRRPGSSSQRQNSACSASTHCRSASVCSYSGIARPRSPAGW